MKVRAYFLILFFLASCANKEPELPSGIRGIPLKLAPEKQELFISTLIEQQVAFIQDSNGFVNYMAYDIAKVKGISREISYGKELNPNVFEFYGTHSSNFPKIFSDKLRESNIPYTKSGSKSPGFSISQIYGPQADIIYQNAYIQWYEQSNH